MSAINRAHILPFAGTRAIVPGALGALLVLAGCGGGVTTTPPGRASSEPTGSLPAAAPASASPSVSQPAGPGPVVPTDVTDETPLELLWQAGGPPPSQPRTAGPDIDAEGRIWVAASFDDMFWVFDRDGGYLESWGTPGTGDGEFDFAANADDSYGGIAFAPDGGFYVADTGNHRVQRFAADRTFLAAWGEFGTAEGQFVSPSVIEVADDASVYVLDDQQGVIQQFDADGTFQRSISPGRAWPLSLATDDASNLYYVEGMPPTLHKVAPDGEVLLRVDLHELLDFPSGIAVRSDGHILAASLTGAGAFDEPDRLIELAPDGSLVRAWPIGGDGIALDPLGDRLYVAFYVWDHLRAYAVPGD
jgi:hypothetical protein